MIDLKFSYWTLDCTYGLNFYLILSFVLFIYISTYFSIILFTRYDTIRHHYLPQPSRKNASI